MSFIARMLRVLADGLDPQPQQRSISWRVFAEDRVRTLAERWTGFARNGLSWCSEHPFEDREECGWWVWQDYPSTPFMLMHCGVCGSYKCREPRDAAERSVALALIGQ